MFNGCHYSEYVIKKATRIISENKKVRILIRATPIGLYNIFLTVSSTIGIYNLSLGIQFLKRWMVEWLNDVVLKSAVPKGVAGSYFTLYSTMLN